MFPSPGYIWGFASESFSQNSDTLVQQKKLVLGDYYKDIVYDMKIREVNGEVQILFLGDDNKSVDADWVTFKEL